MKISIIETKTVPTIKIDDNDKSIIFHSKYDPIREVSAWCNNALKEINDEAEIVIIGLGTGYHIKQLARSIPERKITVIEFNNTFHSWFHDSLFYKNIESIKNVSINLFSNLSSVEQQEMLTSIKSSNLLIHKSGLDTLPLTYSNIRFILEDMQFKKNSIANQIDNMNTNFSKNLQLKDTGIGNLKNKYEGKPMILISAGPSLDKQMTLLKKIYDEDEVILGAVGTAIKPLLKNKIIPHFFSIIDPNPETYSQLTETSLSNTTLFYLSTAYHETVLLHKGPRRILWQEGFADAEKEAKELGDPLIQSGGSVATALLDLMIYLGAGKVALVGQDLAYTDGRSHASHAHAQKNINQSTAEYKTLNYYQKGEVATARNLTIYRKWFEEYARIHPDLELYNCTEGGAFIKNWRHISLNNFYEMVN
ncbi:motility associated factor glycosyltransferase family protein [Oceanobacillus sp. CF4.6]|uniref:motility associated factor glycosyltransferase family protein n=1 Tax=Oceanobacillus sp. CF4.6 TaxID=3373080 RepID=UPI003EE75D0E